MTISSKGACNASAFERSMLEICAPRATTRAKKLKSAPNADTLVEDPTTQKAIAGNATSRATTKPERTTTLTHARSNKVNSLRKKLVKLVITNKKMRASPQRTRPETTFRILASLWREMSLKYRALLARQR